MQVFNIRRKNKETVFSPADASTLNSHHLDFQRFAWNVFYSWMEQSWNDIWKQPVAYDVLFQF